MTAHDLWIQLKFTVVAIAVAFIMKWADIKLGSIDKKKKEFCAKCVSEYLAPLFSQINEMSSHFN